MPDYPMIERIRDAVGPFVGDRDDPMDAARAVLTAMRDPTEAMKLAMYEKIGGGGITDCGVAFACGVDAALEDGR